MVTIKTAVVIFPIFPPHGGFTTGQMSRISPYGHDKSFCIHPAYVRSFLRTLDTFPPRAAVIFHLNQQHQGESNLHHLQGWSNNGPHIGPDSLFLTGVTNCDLDLAPLSSPGLRFGGPTATYSCVHLGKTSPTCSIKNKKPCFSFFLI